MESLVDLRVDRHTPTVCFAGNPCFEPTSGALAPDLSLRSFRGALEFAQDHHARHLVVLLDHSHSLRQNPQLRARHVSPHQFRRRKRFGRYRPLSVFNEDIVERYAELLEGSRFQVDDVLVQTENSCRLLVPHLHHRYLDIYAQSGRGRSPLVGSCIRASACRRPDRVVSDCALIVASHLQTGIETFASGPEHRLFFEKSPRLSFALLNDAIHILLTVRLMDAHEGGHRFDERVLLTVTNRGGAHHHVLYTVNPSGRGALVAMRAWR